MMPEQADENTIALSKKFEASKLPNDTTYLPVFVIERISLLVRADQVLYSEYRSTEDTTRGLQRFRLQELRRLVLGARQLDPRRARGRANEHSDLTGGISPALHPVFHILEVNRDDRVALHPNG